MVRVETPDNMRNVDPSNPLRSTKKEKEKDPEVMWYFVVFKNLNVDINYLYSSMCRCLYVCK